MFKCIFYKYKLLSARRRKINLLINFININKSSCWCVLWQTREGAQVVVIAANIYDKTRPPN